MVFNIISRRKINRILTSLEVLTRQKCSCEITDTTVIFSTTDYHMYCFARDYFINNSSLSLIYELKSWHERWAK